MKRHVDGGPSKDPARLPFSPGPSGAGPSAEGRRLSAGPSGKPQKSCRRTQLTWSRRRPSPLRAQARCPRRNHWCRDQLCSFLAPRPGGGKAGGGGASLSLSGAGSRPETAMPCPRDGEGARTVLVRRGACSWTCRADRSGERSSLLLRRSVLTLHSCRASWPGPPDRGAAGSPTAGPLRRPGPEVDTHTLHTLHTRVNRHRYMHSRTRM